LKKIAGQGYDRLKKHESQLGDMELTVNIKKINNEGRAKVFEVFLKLISKNRSGTFDVRNEEWDIKKALHGAFAALDTHVEHTLKSK